MTRVPTSRSSQIAAELRAEIESGALSPGALLPSTREITRHWKVAMATATKALQILQREGLAKSQPGVGTVVTSRSASVSRGPAAPGTQRRTTGTLLRQSIVKQAIAMADAEGLEELSMRRIAAELNVSTMALYHHVADKDDLLLRMVEHALQENPLPHTQSGQWRDDLEVAAQSMWTAFQHHPWLASTLSITRPQPVVSGLNYVEWNLKALTHAGVDTSTALTVHLALTNYVQGTALNIEIERRSEAESGMDSTVWMDIHEAAVRDITDDGQVPIFAALNKSGYEVNLTHVFDYGLQRFLDGIAAVVPSTCR